MTVFGIDCTSLPPLSALHDAKVRFACRYLSHSSWKNLSRTEVVVCQAASIDLVTVWETTADRALDGRAAGSADARDAERQLHILDAPSDAPIYFAVDWDATEHQQHLIDRYMDGAASVLGRSRVGIYGGYWPVSRAFDGGHVKYAWQTYAWSGGNWDSRRHIEQYSNGHHMGGQGVDYNHALKPDFGQWGGQEDIVASKEELREILRDELPALTPFDAYERLGWGRLGPDHKIGADYDWALLHIRAEQKAQSRILEKLAEKVGIDAAEVREAIEQAVKEQFYGYELELHK